MAYIEFNDVTKEYNIIDKIKYAIKDINFKIDEGEFVLIKGLSGSGKSTIINLLSSFDKPDKGAIIVNGDDINTLKRKKILEYRKKQIGLVNDLIDELTIIENIILAVNLSNDNIDAETYIKKLGFEKKLNYYPFELSTSEKIKASLLVTLCKGSKIILCDDILLNTDVKDQKQMITLLKHLCKKNKNIVIITSRNNKMTAISNKVITLKNGKLESIKNNKKIKPIGDVKW